MYASKNNRPGGSIHVPPLRERPEDIPLLADHFLEIYWADSPCHPRSFTGAAMQALCAYPWPGNIRELRNTVERACYDATGPIIGEAELGFSTAPAIYSSADESKPLAELEKAHLVAQLEKNGWNVAQLARTLKVSRGTVYYKLTKHGIHIKKNGE